MHHTFLKVAFVALILLLWATFALGVGLSYWTPMRTGELPFTISPLERTALWAYITALSFIGMYHVTSPTSNHRRLWCSMLSVAVLFITSALILEDRLYFNAHNPNPEKSGAEKPAIIIGGFATAIILGGVASGALSVVQPKRLVRRETALRNDLL